MDTRLQQRLAAVARRMRSVRLGWSLSLVWFLAAAVGYGLLLTLRGGASLPAETPKWWLIGSLTLAAVAFLGIRLRRHDWSGLAQRLERRFPSLEQRLLTATGIRPQSQDGALGYLQRTVIAEALRHDLRYSWKSLVSSSSIAFAWLANVPAMLCMLLVGVALWHTPINLPSNPLATVNNSSGSQQPIIQPGNTEIERGTSLIVTARFDGRVPDEVWLVHAPPASQRDQQSPENRIAMRPSLKDPIFAAYLYDVRDPLEYRVEYDNSATSVYKVNVFEYPALVRADAELVYPEYSQLDPRTILDTRRVTAATGTQLTWKLHLNKPVASAELVAENVEPIVLTPSSESPQIVQTTLELTESQTWQVKLRDAEGRTNPLEITLRTKVLPNEAAKIQLLTAGDARVSPLEEFDVSAKVNDDFALHATGIGYQFGGGDLVEIATNANREGQTVQLNETIDMEQLAAEPDQLLSYYVWAEDRNERGEVRRVVSDMFFAEVRPFEEIFRQGQQPSASEQQQQQQQQQAGNQQTEELLELQKQIVVGTWNVMREAKTDKLLGRSAPDLVLLAESQESATQLLQEKAAEVNVPGAEAIIAAAARNMQSAIEQLTTTSKSLAKSDLMKALSHEQAAYQELLRLQSREHEVVRSQQSSQSQSQSQRSQARQQQIDQLELDNQQNRYEEERLAQEEQNSEQSELRQVISRLRELASRQEDLNEQLREIQAALQAAETQEEQEELQRQLERLREQQQQMLQDSDELQERMDSQSNETSQQTQEQMQQARENLQQSSEALRQGDTSQALSAGTRAEQELKDLQDEVRQQAADQFQQTMQDMRQQARELEQRQSEIVEQMSRTESEPSAGLRASDEEQDVSQQLQEQQSGLQNLLENMQQTVEQAEDAEPLLAQKLYDSYRRTQQEQALDRLDVTEQLLERNLGPQARELAGQSSEDLSTLRQEIDEAAEAVLGSELESLRLALNQLDTLTEQLDNEIARGTGQTPNQADPQQGDPQQGDPQQGDPQQGDPQQGDPQQGDPQQGDPQQGDPQQGDPQQGDPQQGDPQQGQPQPGQPQPGQPQPGQPQQGQPQPGQPQPGQPQQGQPQQGQPQQGQPQQGQPQQGQPQQGPGLRPSSPNQSSTAGNARNTQTGNPNPITGDEFREWSDRLRDVEELMVDPELRWEATQIRQAAREVRSELKKHAAEPQWSEIEEVVATPLRELQRKVADELIRQAADKTEIVPIDRDPVPREFSRSVRKYFENLGSGQ